MEKSHYVSLLIGESALAALVIWVMLHFRNDPLIFSESGLTGFVLGVMLYAYVKGQFDEPQHLGKLESKIHEWKKLREFSHDDPQRPFF
jgi:hypothetical protein